MRPDSLSKHLSRKGGGQIGHLTDRNDWSAVAVILVDAIGNGGSKG